MIALFLLAQFAAEPVLELELGTPPVAVTIHDWNEKEFVYSTKAAPDRRMLRDWASLTKDRITQIANAYFESRKGRPKQLSPIKVDASQDNALIIDLGAPPFVSYLPKDAAQITLVPLAVNWRNRGKTDYPIVRTTNRDLFSPANPVNPGVEPAYATRTGWDFHSGDQFLAVSSIKAKINRPVRSGDDLKTAHDNPQIELVIQRHVLSNLSSGAVAAELAMARNNPEQYVAQMDARAADLRLRFEPKAKSHHFPELRVSGVLAILSNGRLRCEFPCANVPVGRELHLSTNQVVTFYKTQSAAFIKAFRDFQRASATLDASSTAHANIIQNLERTYQAAQDARAWNEYWHGPHSWPWWSDRLVDFQGYDANMAFAANATYASNEQNIRVGTAIEENRQNQVRGFIAGVQKAAANSAAGSLRKMQSMQQQLAITQMLLFYLELVNSGEITIEYAVYCGDKLIACTMP
jgi:hypothetical protein